MIVYNPEARIIVLGDGQRERDADGKVIGKKPGDCTWIYPGKHVALNDIPESRKSRFVNAVKDCIKAGHKLKILDSVADIPKSDPDLELARRRAEMAKVDALTAPTEEPKKGPGRPRKSPPLGG